MRAEGARGGETWLIESPGELLLGKGMTRICWSRPGFKGLANHGMGGMGGFGGAGVDKKRRTSNAFDRPSS